MGKTRVYPWRFFYAGGFEQVQLETPADLARLKELDQKLWASLACPTEGLEIDERLLKYIDQNKDGRVRAPEILAVIDWVLARLGNADLLFKEAPVRVADFADNEEGQALAITAQRLLDILERKEDEGLTAQDTDNLALLFPPHLPNGDGLVPEAMTNDDALNAAIRDILTCIGEEKDRSGEPAVSAAAINSFFKQAHEVHAWYQEAEAVRIQEFAENTDTAAAAYRALKEKIDDFFTRVELVAYDARAAELVNGEEAELVRLSALSLATTDELAPLPLATVGEAETLPLITGINPAWRQAVESFREQVVKPLFGDLEALTQEQWQTLSNKFTAYFSWQEKKPNVAIMAELSAERVAELVDTGTQEQLLELVNQDEAVAEAANGLLDLDKLLRCQQSLVELLKNFISFQHFYSRKRKAIFQAGTLYIDGKSCDLAVEVNDVEAHAAVAVNSNNYLLYCRCTRRGQPVKNKEEMHIVVAVTAGSEGGLVVGRNGLFYDRQGNDWDATVVKVVASPISIRDAFWSPYRRIASFISEQIQKLAQDRDSEVVSKASGAATEGGDAEQNKAFDIAKFAGIFAAIGLAMAALGTAFAGLVAGLKALLWWQWPLVFLGIILFVSGPSMLLAWFKLRQRNLGPILDANGWAVNTRARISINFGTRLTQLAYLPEGAKRTFNSASDQKSYLKPLLVTLTVVVVLAAWLTYKMS